MNPVTAAGTPPAHIIAAAAQPVSVSGGVAVGTGTGVAVILAVVLIVNVWKKGSPRLSGWLALFAGLTGAVIVLSWLGTAATMSIYGVGIWTIIGIGGGFILWHELLKKRGLHRVRTPVIALLTGVALATTTGGLLGAATHAADHAVTTGVVKVVPGAGQNGG